MVLLIFPHPKHKANQPPTLPDSKSALESGSHRKGRGGQQSGVDCLWCLLSRVTVCHGSLPFSVSISNCPWVFELTDYFTAPCILSIWIDSRLLYKCGVQILQAWFSCLSTSVNPGWHINPYLYLNGKNKDEQPQNICSISSLCTQGYQAYFSSGFLCHPHCFQTLILVLLLAPCVSQ